MRLESHEHLEGWEEALSEELRQLPEVKAPETLIPRVMAVVRARARLPWWQQTWWHWPPAAQVLVVLVFLGVLVGVGWYSPQVWDAIAAAQPGQAMGEWLRALDPLADCGKALVSAFALVARRAGPLALGLAGVVCLAMYLSCVVLGTMMYRMAFSKR